jgi:serine/threonine protein kinase
MRGTVCYVAPECGGGPCEHGSELLEKADVYSFGVLVLVILSGRRPLHILSSPMKLEKANLVSWCRQLARAGNVLELMDERLDGGYDKDQATKCVQLALLCLQRQPELRPDSTDIVKILDGEMELPPAPVEFSPSPRVRPFPRSSRRAAQPDAAE